MNVQEMVEDLIAEGHSKAEAWRMVRQKLEDKKKPTPKPDRTRRTAQE